MGTASRLQWLRRVAATSALIMGGTAAISPRALDELLEEAERLVEDEADCLGVLHVLARDPRPALRALVAEAAGTISDPHSRPALQVLRGLAHDSSARVRAAVSRGLARWLERSTPAERIELVCEWALSRAVQERAALAAAIAGRTPLFVTDLVIEQLALDDSAEVRALALKAALTHASDAPSAYRRIARERLSDPDAAVRSVAESLLARLG